MVESGYVTHATSSTAAVGIWQFMKPTALNYGLGVSPQWDERSHPIAATDAASHYLTDLHRKFDSWYLAIAAYNAGPGRIAKAVRRGKTRDFWKLAERGYLPQETMDYIPKFLAAATIGAHLEQFGFESLRSNQQWPEIASLDLKLKNKKMKLSALAIRTALDEKELLRFNPQLEHALTHAGQKRIRIWVPKESAEYFMAHSKSRMIARNQKSRSAYLVE